MADRAALAVAVDAALRRAGLDTGGFSPHSWRCEHPDRYPGYCDCVESTRDEVLDAIEEAQRA